MAKNRREIAYFDCAAQFSCVSPIMPPQETPQPKLPDLTCLRGAAALWVYAYHVNLQLGGGGWGLLRRGYLGVDAFFMLSGLVLAYAHPRLAVRGAALLRFWGRRLARLYPVHLATLGLLAAAVGLAWACDVPIRDAGRFGIGELLRSLLLLHGWGLSGRWAWNYPSWSISTEWAGYLAFPWLWLAVRRLPPAAAAVLPAAALLALLAVGAGPVGLNLTYQGALFRFVPEFVAGLALARLAAPLAALIGGGAAGGAALAIAAAAWLLAVAVLPDALVVAALWCVLAALAAGALCGARRLDRLPGLRAFGVLSYAFYMSFALGELAAVTLLRALGRTPPSSPVAYFALTTLLTLGLAAALHRFVERPALRRFSPRAA